MGRYLVARAKKQGYSLGPLQQQILLHLATKGAKNTNETAKEISAHYRSAHAAFHSLEEKEMITRVGKVSCRGQDYDVFWLTERGLLEALLNGADSNLVLKAIKRTFPKHEDAFLFARVASRLPKKVLRIVLSLYPSLSSQVGIQEVLKLVFMTDLSLDDLKILYDILKESSFKEITDETIRKAGDKLQELEKIIGVRSN